MLQGFRQQQFIGALFQQVALLAKVREGLGYGHPCQTGDLGQMAMGEIEIFKRKTDAALTDTSKPLSDPEQQLKQPQFRWPCTTEPQQSGALQTLIEQKLLPFSRAWIHLLHTRCGESEQLQRPIMIKEGSTRSPGPQSPNVTNSD